MALTRVAGKGWNEIAKKTPHVQEVPNEGNGFSLAARFEGFGWIIWSSVCYRVDWRKRVVGDNKTAIFTRIRIINGRY